MTREQDLIAAFTVAIRELGVNKLKTTSMFASGQTRCEADQLPKAA